MEGLLEFFIRALDPFQFNPDPGSVLKKSGSGSWISPEKSGFGSLSLKYFHFLFYFRFSDILIVSAFFNNLDFVPWIRIRIQEAEMLRILRIRILITSF